MRFYAKFCRMQKQDNLISALGLIGIIVLRSPVLIMYQHFRCGVLGDGDFQTAYGNFATRTARFMAPTDIAAMIRTGVNLSGGLAAARKIFGLNFQPSESLKALIYFGDGDLHTLSKEDKNVLVEAVSTVRELPDIPILSKVLVAPVQ
jgi:hypothetical protein